MKFVSWANLGIKEDMLSRVKIYRLRICDQEIETVPTVK